MLQSILSDISHGIIQKDEKLAIHCLQDEPEIGGGFTKELKSLSHELTFARIFRQEIEPAAPMRASEWENRFKKTWLSQPSKSARNSRQYLLMVFQKLRDLEGLEARENTSLLQGSWNVSLVALKALRAEDIEPDEDSRGQI